VIAYPHTYIIDRTATGKAVTKTAQIRMCGNSVCPPIARAIIRAHFAHEVRKEAAA
jgi:DNA (cytosine-5)-methyltransferase 1